MRISAGIGKEIKKYQYLILLSGEIAMKKKVNVIKMKQKKKQNLLQKLFKMKKMKKKQEWAYLCVMQKPSHLHAIL
jgi:hypothetical protein